MKTTYSVKFYNRVINIINLPFKLFMNPEVINKENIPDEPLIFMGNHFSYADPFMLGLALKERQLRFMAKKELFRTGLLSHIIYKLGAFSIDRSGNDITASRTALDLLKQGEDIVIYAEGTRNKRRDERSVLPFEPGIERISILSKTRIMPFAASGNYGFRSHPVLKFGLPFKVEKTKNNRQLFKIIYDDFEEDIAREHTTEYMEDMVESLIIR